jgi:hypothetical protein
VSTNRDFGGIANLHAMLANREQEPELQAMLIEVARVWADEVLNPISDSYGWQSFADQFSNTGYTDVGGAFGAWGLPSIDSDYWTDRSTLEKRISTYYQIKSQGGPKGNVVQHPASEPDFTGEPTGGWGTQPPQQQQPPQWQQPQAGGPGQQWGQPQQGGWSGQQQEQQHACRKCGNTNLVQRNVKKQGQNFGRPYMGCSNPQCNAFVRWAS